MEAERRRYILVGLADGERGEEWLEKMAASVDELVGSRLAATGSPGTRSRWRAAAGAGCPT